MSDREEIERAIADFIEGYNASDLGRVLACYSEDLIKLRAGAEPETKPVLVKRLESVFARYRGQLEVRNEELVTSGGLAYARGRFKVTLLPRDGGPPETIERRYLEIWRKDSGQWRVARTMDNSGEPGR